MGPMTGRGAGYCSRSTVPGYANPYGSLGRGYGFGAGFGRGLGRGFSYGATPLAPLTPQAEKELLESELQAIRKRLEEIKKADE